MIVGPRDFLKIDDGVGGDFAGQDDKPGRDERFAGDAALRILREDGVEDRIGNLIGNFVGVSLGYGLRRKQMAAVTAHYVVLLRGDRWRGRRPKYGLRDPRILSRARVEAVINRREAAPRARAYRSGSSRGPRGRASSGSIADRRRARAGAWQTNVAARAGSACAAVRPSGRSPSGSSRTRRATGCLPRFALTNSQGDWRLPRERRTCLADVAASASPSACSPMGTMRCLFPFPVQDRYPASRFRSLARRWISSDTRMPVAYSTSISARSRSPRGVETSGCADQPLDFARRRGTSAAPARPAGPADRRPDCSLDVLRQHGEKR